jgi:hypothetical protein
LAGGAVLANIPLISGTRNRVHKGAKPSKSFFGRVVNGRGNAALQKNVAMHNNPSYMGFGASAGPLMHCMAISGESNTKDPSHG